MKKEKIKVEKEPKFKTRKIKKLKEPKVKINSVEELLPPSYRPLSSWNYFWRTLLYIIPVIGWAFMIAYAANGKSRHGRAFARGFIIFTVLLIAAVAAAFGLGLLKF
ncbi:MAG: hypothetical protein J6V22_05180 [Clostridia bacterium]|nr:hypothetical protein [Clostridia bacterium]